MIAAVSWIPKGVAKSVPKVADPPSKEEIEEMLKNGALDISGDVGSEEDDGDMDLDTSKHTDVVSQALAVANALGRTPQNNQSTAKFDDVADAMKELDMDKYDDEDDDIQLFSRGLGDLYYPSNEADPYLKDNDDDDDLEEIEDLTIKPKDAVIVCARNEDEFSHLEVWICEDSGDGESNMYVHHDVVLSAFPLCTAWLDCPLKDKGEEKGNFIAVGSMEPSIEIWDLDIVDELQPTLVLGGIIEKKKKKKTKKKSTKYVEGSHTDAVLGLAWNKQIRNILASASADKLVKIWDVTSGACDTTLDHHTDKAVMLDKKITRLKKLKEGKQNKVQAVAWNEQQPRVLLSGSFDRSIVMKDGRAPNHPGWKWSVGADVESLAWDPHNNVSFVVSLEDGKVQGFDIRTLKPDSTSGSNPIFTLHAHDKAVCSVSYNPSVPNLLATGSTDKMVKLWDLSNNQPSCIASKNPKAGGVFSVSFSGDDAFMLAIGGSKGKLEVWDTSSDAGVARRFGNYSTQTVPHLEK